MDQAQFTDFRRTPLLLPPYPLRLSEQDGVYFVFDFIRKKHLVCTPEEWVRQHWIHHLIEKYEFPKALIMPESGLKFNNMPRRSDLLVSDRDGRRLLLAEFKNPKIKITEAVFEQVARYNSVFEVPYLLVSNGIEHYYCHVDFKKKTSLFLEELPIYSRMF